MRLVAGAWRENHDDDDDEEDDLDLSDNCDSGAGSGFDDDAGSDWKRSKNF